MASPHVYNSLKVHLQGVMTPMQVIDFDTIDTALEQGTASFLAIEELISDEVQTSLGDPSSVCLREDSLIDVHCYVPAPESSSSCRGLAEQVQIALRAQIIAGVRVVGVTPPEMGVLNDGLWSVASIGVSAQYDRHVPVP